MAYPVREEPGASTGYGLRSLSGYVVAALLSVAIAAILLRLWRADLALPFIHKSDAVFIGACIKGIMENGWYLTNPRLGAPGGLDLRDYPMADSLHFAAFKLLALFAHNWAVVLNVYFLLTFPLTALSALFVFRRFRCRYGPALVGSLLFTFLPYHFLRGELHLFLAAYYMVPLLIMLILEVFLDLPVFLDPTARHAGRRWLKPVQRILLCVMAASAGVYYSFFACYLLLVAGFSCWLLRRTLVPVLRSVALVTILCLGTALNLYPTIAYHAAHGPNRQCPVREPLHADIFGLQPIQLLLPVTDHRLPVFKNLKRRFNDAFRPLVNENDHASLGLIGSLGFLLLLGRFLYKNRAGTRPRLEDALAISSLACLFLCTMGGLGSLFSLLITPMIRGYNRVSVYLAFFSLFMIVLACEPICARLGRIRGGRVLSGLTLLAILAGGIWDQTTRKIVPPYSWVCQEVSSDERFVGSIEALLPEGAMVFQLPYAWFPEQGPICHMADYDHLRGYLHSNHLRWSYGAFKGRPGDAWLKELSSKPLEELVRGVREAGFSGIYIDRCGYPDDARELEGKLNLILGEQPLVSPNKLLAFFKLPDASCGASSP